MGGPHTELPGETLSQMGKYLLVDCSQLLSVGWLVCTIDSIMNAQKVCSGVWPTVVPYPLQQRLLAPCE